jgi:hypothetical protein
MTTHDRYDCGQVKLKKKKLQAALVNSTIKVEAACANRSASLAFIGKTFVNLAAALSDCVKYCLLQ